MKFQKCKLSDIADIVVSSVDKKTKPNEQAVRLCNFVDVYNNWAITFDMQESFMKASASTANIQKLTLHKGQVAFTKDSETRDDIGVPCYIADDLDSVVLGYHCALITPKEGVLSGKYLNAFMHSDYIKKYFELNATGSGMRFTLSSDTMASMPVLLPSFEEQERIGELFADIDRKISLNRQINHNLEAMAKQLYDYWFVQFDFPDEEGKPYKSSGGEMVWNEKLQIEIPSGWETALVGKLLASYPNTRRITTKEYLSDGAFPIFDQNSSKYVAGYTNDKDSVLNQYPAILFGDHSTCVKFINMPFARGADGTQILYLKEETITPYYFYQAIKALKIPNPGYSRHFKYLKEMRIIKPNENVVTTYESLAKQMYSLWTDNVLAISALTKQRDELLPLLMNGQASVNYDLSHD